MRDELTEFDILEKALDKLEELNVGLVPLNCNEQKLIKKALLKLREDYVVPLTLSQKVFIINELDWYDNLNEDYEFLGLSWNLVYDNYDKDFPYSILIDGVEWESINETLKAEILAY